MCHIQTVEGKEVLVKFWGILINVLHFMIRKILFLYDISSSWPTPVATDVTTIPQVADIRLFHLDSSHLGFVIFINTTNTPFST